jgi:hypothetical protein
MKASRIYKKFEKTVNWWDRELDKYAEQDLQRSPGPGLWTIGQVYEHITASTLNFHVKQIEECLGIKDNLDKRKSTVGYISLIIKRIPPIQIKIPPEENFAPVQPPDKSYIRQRLQELKDRFSKLAIDIDANPNGGKTNHPGMGYLKAQEWFEIIEMHLRYHLKDKRTVDNFLLKV